jgi:hypothetical protein
MSNKRVFETNAEHVYPVESPDLSLDFINSRGIDPAYSFTRNSSATYVGPDGFIKTAAVNQPRFDFDPVTGDYRGLLVEESRTNLLTYSNTFDVAWTDTNIIRNTTAALAPDGTNSALRVTAGNDNATVIRNVAVGSDNTRTFSIYLRRVSGSGLIQFTFDGGSSWTTITQSITNTWSRFILFTNFTNHRVGLRIVTTGDSIELWGSQLEVGVETSYIPTTTTTVTRQPDQLILNKTLNTQGTLYVESRPTTGVPLVADNGSSSLSVSQNPNQYSKSVLYYNTDRILRMSSDGGVPTDSSSFFAPQDLNRVSLGFNRFNNTAYINGHLKKFSYYSSPLSEDNLRALTGNKRSIFRSTKFGVNIIGGIVTEIQVNDLIYRVHTFTTVGDNEITVLGGGEVEYLIVAGGGGGGSRHGGGGGAGGVKTSFGSIPITLFSQVYSIEIGAGGSGAVSGPGTIGNKGNNSSAFDIVADGGGAGSSGGTFNTLQNGGSGGGSRGNSTVNGGSGTLGQGKNGGSGVTQNQPVNYGLGGGGGGFLQDGTNGNANMGFKGRGGNGFDASSFLGTSFGDNGWFAGGGGSGSTDVPTEAGNIGGLGGGGNGNTEGSNNSTGGVDGTGGGGAGGGHGSGGNYPGRPGGSGIVIIRYPIGVVGQ